MIRLIVLATAVWAAPAGAQTASPEGDGTPRIQEPLPYRMLTPGLLAREVFAARDADSGLAVSVWGLVLGPGGASEEARLEEDLILLVRSGRGILTLGDRHEELAVGISRSVPAGLPFRIENFDDAAPLSLRGVLLRDAG